MNSRRADIVSAAKGHYREIIDFYNTKCVIGVIAYHNGVIPGDLSWISVCRVITNEFPEFFKSSFGDSLLSYSFSRDESFYRELGHAMIAFIETMEASSFPNDVIGINPDIEEHYKSSGLPLFVPYDPIDNAVDAGIY